MVAQRTPVVSGLKIRFGLDAVVLRLLAPDTRPGDGGLVTYLAQVHQPPSIDLEPWQGPDPLSSHPLRAQYAYPGGPQADVAWATAALIDQGIALTGPPQQLRTWNMSTIWRLSTDVGLVWLKVSPEFLAHEAGLVSWLPPALGPRVLAARPGRLLTEDLPGDDHYDAGFDVLLELVDRLHGLQRGAAKRIGEMLRLGVPDRRLQPELPAIAGVFERHAAQLSPERRSSVDKLIAGLPRRFADIQSCGVPDTLVHGDFHPGNSRGELGQLVVLDWADAFIGHPGHDILRMSGWPGAASMVSLIRRWSDHWRAAVPGCDPGRAVELLRPVDALYGAVWKQRFLDKIEPDEHPYHSADPLAWLAAAA